LAHKVHVLLPAIFVCRPAASAAAAADVVVVGSVVV
jgi:hypothetical protein